MDGLTGNWCRSAIWAVALGIASSLVLPRARAQEVCDTGNPCARTDTASQPAIGPSTGANNPIDILSGNKYQAETDFQLPGELGLSFTRHYNSASVQGGAFGGGWSHTYETALLRVERDAATSITVVQADGRRIQFKPRNSQHAGVRRYDSVPFGYGVIEEDVSAIEALRASSAVAPSSQPWRWIWADRRQLTFDARGTLMRVQAASGEWIALDRDKHGRLTRILDFAGREMRLAYWDRPSEWLPSYDGRSASQGAKHRLKSLTLPDQGVIHYFYDENGLLAEARFPDGTRKRYQYEDTGGALLLSRVVSRDERIQGSYTYDSNGLATLSEAAHDQRVRLERVEASAGALSTSVLTNSLSENTRYRWKASPFGHQLLEAEGPGCAACPASNVRYTYDEHGLIVRIDRLEPTREGAPLSELIERDHFGRVTMRQRERSGSRELIERFEYSSDDPLAQPTRVVRPSIAPGQMHSFELSYNDRGQPTRVIEMGYAPSAEGDGFEPIVRSATYSYYEPADGAPHLVGRLHAIDGPLPGESDRTQLLYDARGLLTRVVYSTGDEERFSYDALGRLTEHVPLDGVSIELEHDDAGRVRMYTRAGLRTVVTYDPNGRIAKLHDPIGQQFSFEYDGARLSAIFDSANNRIEFEVDRAGRPVARRLLNPDGTIAQQSLDPLHASVEPSSKPEPFSPATLSFIRLPAFKTWAASAHELIAPASLDETSTKYQRVVDERGLASHYRFDDFGRLSSALNPDAGLITFEYDEASRVLARRFADGRSIRYAYDALGRVETIAAGEERVHITYGPFNKPDRIAYAWGDERFEYDFAARVILRAQQIDGHRFERFYRYDELGRLSEATQPDGTTLVYRYNASMHAKPGVLSSIERKGWLRSTPIITGLNEADDLYGQRTARFGNGLELERELDMNGRLRRFGTAGVALFEFETDVQGRIVTANDGRRHEFAYDTAGRLSRAVLSGHAPSQIAYDDAGNARVTASSEARTLLRVDATTNRLLSKIDSRGVEIRYTYDAAGRTTSIGNRSFQYDSFGRLARISHDGAPLAEYTYNAFGERIRKVVYSGSRRSVTYFFYDGSKLTAEADERGRVTKQFVYVDARPIAVLAGASTYALHTDWLGTPIAATDDERRVVWRAETDPLNHVRSQWGALRIDLRGSNQYFDGESGLHYNLHRFFDPSTSRYLTPDPIGQLGGSNLYAFANGDPINFIDPLGFQAIPANWQESDRLRVVFQGAIDAFPQELRDSVAQALRDLIQPEAIATAAAIFAAWGVSQLTPFGWAADLVIVGLGFAFMGVAIVELARGTMATYAAMRDAQTMEELCAAGRGFARTITEAILALAGGGGLANAARRIGPNVAAQIRRMFGRTSRPPPPAPLPWTQEMLQRVTDGYGNQIRQFMAGRNHMWRTEAERLRWQSLEDAADSFARNYFGAEYVIDAKHLNGVLDHPRATHGFDVVFVNSEGRLVIGEAKSGTEIDAITAFGAGARGEAQLELNLRVLLDRVERDPKIPRSVKDLIIEQVEARSFETHLYVPPSTSITDGRLDVFQEILGRPLDRIFILPEAPPARD